MKLKLYQIDMNRDADNVAFFSYHRYMDLQERDTIDASIYDLVFDGELNCDSLENAFYLLQRTNFERHVGRSASVSDIFEISDPLPDMEPGFYYCDEIGFQKVEFDPQQAQDKTELLRVVMLEPGKLARETLVGTSLPEIQQAIGGGDFEAIFPFEDQACIVCDVDGKIKGLPLNRALHENPEHIDLPYKDLRKEMLKANAKGENCYGYVTFSSSNFLQEYSEASRTYRFSCASPGFEKNSRNPEILGDALDGSDDSVRLDLYLPGPDGKTDGWEVEKCYLEKGREEIIDIIAGPCFIVNCEQDHFASLSEAQMRKYLQDFQLPEKFFYLGKTISSRPFIPTLEKEQDAPEQDAERSL